MPSILSERASEGDVQRLPASMVSTLKQLPLSPSAHAAAGAAPSPPPEHPLRALVAELLVTLPRRRIPFAALRGDRELAAGEEVADVDLLVAPTRFDAFERELETLCRQRRVTIHSRHHAGFLHQYHLHARTAEGEHVFLAVDVHLAECGRGIPFLDADELLLGATPTSPPRLAEFPAALTSFLGPWLAGGKVRADYADELRRAAARHCAEARRTLRRIFGPRGAARLLCRLETRDDAALAREAPAARRHLARRAFARHPLRSLRWFLPFLYGTRLRPLAKPRGRFLVFLGTDGSGKSTLAEAVARRLASVYRDGAPHIVHLRPGFLPQLNTLLHLGRTTYSLEDMSEPHRAAPSGRLVSNLRAAYYWLDYWIGYAVKIRPRRRKHSLLVFDRYYHDYLVDPRRFRVRHGTGACPLLARRTPRPDDVFVCTAPAALVHERKQELAPPEIARQIAAFEELAAREGFGVIRTTESIERCVERVLDLMYPPIRVDRVGPVDQSKKEGGGD